jgi:hypothetical protein
MLKRVLVYKRTHDDDPDSRGCFGSGDCMKSFRAREFDAVIGIGGVASEALANRIAGKLNWIGIGPHKRNTKGKKGPLVTFDHFVHYHTRGPDFTSVAPLLAARVYRNNIRSLVHGFTKQELTEVNNILRRAFNAPASRGLSLGGRARTSASCKGESARRCC